MTATDASPELLALALTELSEGSLVTDAGHQTIYANRAFTEVTGYEVSEIVGTNCRFLQGPQTSPAELQRMRDALDNGQVFQGTLLNYRKDGSPFWNHLTITPLIDDTGAVTHFVSVQRDVTEQVEERDALSHLAAHDQLTGLPNRYGLRRHLRRELADAAEEGSVIAVALIDLDDFKLINDQHGHLAGDTVLREFADRMTRLLRRGDFLARLGGDEFVVVVPGLTSIDPLADFGGIAERLHAAVQSPFALDDRNLASVGISMGVALAPRDGATGLELVRTADAALYRAKRHKGGPRWWDASPTATTERGTGAPGRPQPASGELVMFMQPIVDLRSGQVTQVEALARLRTPSGELKAPDTFLPFYSRHQLVDVFKQGLDQALSWVPRWESLGIVLNVSVNVSPELLSNPDSFGWVTDALTRHNVDATRLSLEWLEDQEIDLASSENTITELVRLGVKLHLDDLGSGFATLNRLTQVPFDVIKIDRRIFDQAHARPIQVLTVLAALTELGADSGYGTVVEGIENHERLEASAVLGAGAGQGFLFAPPMPPEEIESWLEQFTMPYRDGELTTALGALAYLWSHGGGDGPEHPTEHCPLTAYLAVSDASDDTLEAHRTLHQEPPTTSTARAIAHATLLGRLAEQAQRAQPSTPSSHWLDTRPGARTAG
ncbi:MAG TPA: EAL domain-containing protein [Pseudolysinimonas sp.]|nr:EAL domain-containing protein [Pseudolysinimonas sp.]